MSRDYNTLNKAFKLRIFNESVFQLEFLELEETASMQSVDVLYILVLQLLNSDKVSP